MTRAREEEWLWNRAYLLEEAEKGIRSALLALAHGPYATAAGIQRDADIRALLQAAQELLEAKQEANKVEHDALHAEMYPEDWAAHQVAV